MPTLEELQAQIAELQARAEAAERARDGLLTDKQKGKWQAKSVEDRLAQLEEQREAEAANLKATFEAERAAMRKAHEAQLSHALLARDSYVIGSDMKAALAAAGVLPALAPAVEALMKARGAKVAEKDGALVAMIGDKPAVDYLKEWAASDEGKHFVPAANSGAGAAGGAAGQGQTGKNPYAKGSVNLTEQGKLEKANPQLAAQLKAAAG